LSLSNEIKSYALQLGFHKVGIAKVEVFSEEGQHLREWLARGYHGTMEWMNRNTEKRIDVRNIFPDAKSIISVALNYQTPHSHSEKKTMEKFLATLGAMITTIFSRQNCINFSIGLKANSH